MLLLNPGRFGAGFTPDDLDSITAWWDAQTPSTITESMGEVTQWDDRVGSADVVKDTNGPEKVLFQEGTMLRFDSSNSERMKVTDSAMDPGTGDVTYIVVYRATNSTKGVLCGKTGSGARMYGMFVNDAAAEELSAEFSDSAGSPVATTVAATNFYTDGQVRFAAVTFDATANEVKLYVDDFDAATEVDSDLAFDPATIDPTNPFFIGSLDGTADYFEGSIGEVICFNEVLSTADMASVETYIRARWELTSFVLDPGVGSLPGTITGRWSSWDEDDYIIGAGEVTLVDDLSGNGNDMVNGHATTSTGPGILDLDGTDWLDYTGAELLGVTESDTDPAAADITWIVVFRAEGVGSMAMTGKLGAGNPHYLMNVNVSGSNLYTQIRDTSVGNVSILAGAPEDYSDSTKRLAAMTYDDNLADNFLYGRSAYEAIDSDLSYNSVDISPSNPLFIGSSRDDGTQLWDGQIGEVIYFSEPLNTIELSEWYHYLKRKWGFYNK